MPTKTSIMGLHFRYRLWIAEMNFHINILRICEDYVAEISSKKNEPEVKRGIETFEKEFVTLRKEIDQLRHEMHLAKMTLAASSKQVKTLDAKALVQDNHVDLRKRFLAYRKMFDRVKKEFVQFESTWLQ
jgi:predicted  nucleic acid-binding Zn-ribbon protein